MKLSGKIGIALTLAVALYGCDEPAETEQTARAQQNAGRQQLTVTLDELNGSGVTGTATFAAAHGRTTLLIEVKAATPGHLTCFIYEGGTCETAGDGEASAPMSLTVAEDGTATFMAINQNWSLDTGQAENLIGRRIVLSEEQPVSCGVIE
jgi:Cu/Zn superoxide dismutase